MPLWDLYLGLIPRWNILFCKYHFWDFKTKIIDKMGPTVRMC